MSPTTIDVSGLPEPVVRQIERLVETLREQGAPASGAGAHGRPEVISAPQLTREEFEAKLREMASGTPVPTLPPDFSRADLYYDHD